MKKVNIFFVGDNIIDNNNDVLIIILSIIVEIIENQYSELRYGKKE